MGVKNFLYATVLSTALTIGQRYFDESYPVKSKYALQERGVVAKIDNPGYEWEGNIYLNWSLIVAGLWFLDVPLFVKAIIFSTRFTIPVFYSAETPFNSTFLLIGATGLLSGNWLIALIGFLKVVLYDLRNQWFIYSVFEQRADVASSILAKTTIVYGYPVTHLILFYALLGFYSKWLAIYYAGMIAFGISLLTWWYIIPHFDKELIRRQ